MKTLLRNRVFIALLALSVLAPLSSYSAAVDCVAGFRKLYDGKQEITQKAVAAARTGLIKALSKDGAPAFLKETRNGKVPVVLMNTDTYGTMNKYLDSSIGTQVHLQPDWQNDHGSIRVMQNLVDVDLPGERGFGEINKTGIAWKPLKSYLARGPSDAIIETSYYLTPEEKQTADIYHRMRRAALIRAPFTFGGADADMNLPNMLQNGGEHCFIFCKATAVPQHVREMQQTLKEFGVDSLDTYLKKPEVKKFLAQAQKVIQDADVTKELKPSMLTTDKATLALLKKIVPAGIAKSPKELQDFGNMLVGYTSSKDYGDLMRTLGVTGDVGYADMNNPRITAVLVYDPNDPQQEFHDATYETAGKFSTWTKAGQSPLK